MMKLSVVIPAYNEETRIAKTLTDIDSFLEKQPYDYEIVVIVNGSHDRESLAGRGAKVGGSVYLDRGFTTASAVVLSRSSVGGSLACHGARLAGVDIGNVTQIRIVPAAIVDGRHRYRSCWRMSPPVDSARCPSSYNPSPTCPTTTQQNT